VRFSRHAKNNARDIGATVADAERLIQTAIHVDTDLRGRPRYTGYIREVRVRVVVALDDPNLIVTIHQRRN
jgi:hypothetical protein